PLDARAELEHPRRLALQLPLRRETGGELAVGPATGEVVEDVERDADVVRRRALVRIERRDVTALGDDQLLLLRRLRGRRARKTGRERGHRARRGGGLEHVTSGDLCHTRLLENRSVGVYMGALRGSCQG